MGPAGWSVLEKLLEPNNALQILNLSNNQLDESCTAGLWRLIWALAKRSLLDVDVGNNPLNDTKTRASDFWSKLPSGQEPAVTALNASNCGIGMGG
eukprot:3939985-Rhodomonas_salina.1